MYHSRTFHKMLISITLVCLCFYGIGLFSNQYSRNVLSHQIQDTLDSKVHFWEAAWYRTTMACPRKSVPEYQGRPRDGWQKSSFHKNWYSGGTELPGQDSQAMTDLPFSLEELTEHVPESREACGGYWDRLAALVETQASVN